MHFDRFDICEAYFCHAVAWNGSLKSERIFAALKRIGFRRAMTLRWENLTDNGREILDRLEAAK